MTGITGTETRRSLSAKTLIGDKVVDPHGEHLGSIEELMIDLDKGCVSYAVLSFGGILGIGDKLFAVPWQAFRIDEDRQEFVLNVPKERLHNAPGFDKRDWPDFADPTFMRSIDTYYGYERNW